VRTSSLRRRVPVGLLLIAMLTSAAACSPDDPSPKASPKVTATTNAPAVDTQESGPASPIAYGIRVPDGAVQLGPLVRIRSTELLNAYSPELEAALAEQSVASERTPEPSATPTPTPEESEPTPTPTSPIPKVDTFNALEEVPRPDVTISLMRVAGKPTVVVQRMLAEIAALLPDQEIVTNNLSQYCTAESGRITGCELAVSGTTPRGRLVDIHLTVDPGDFTTRTANPGSREDPVMVLAISYVGDPREGQSDREVEDLGSIKEPAADTSGLIWPKMDLSAPGTESLLGSWLGGDEGTLLLSGDQPVRFASVVTPKPTGAVEMATEFMKKYGPKAHITTDDIVQLNESTMVTRGLRKDGSTLMTVTTIAARGNFITAFVVPAGRTKP
jgi:hypothetical protein